MDEPSKYVADGVVEKKSPTTLHMAEPKATYKVHPGAIYVGLHYEYKVAALLALRSLLEGAEDMWLASSADGVGHFDDLILHVRTTENKCATYMLQIKHKQRPKNILKAEFISTKGDFSLLRYLEDIAMVHKSIQSESSQKTIFEKLGSLENIHFLIFTNRGMNDCEFFEKTHENLALNFLDTSSAGKVYRFNVKHFPEEYLHKTDLESAFSSNFYILINQANFQQIDDEIFAATKKIIGHVSSSVDIKHIVLNFERYIEKRLQNYLGDRFYLTKEDILYKLTELLLKQYILNLRNEPFIISENDAHVKWKQIVTSQAITIVEFDENVLKFLIQYVGNEVSNYYNKPVVAWTDTLPKMSKKLGLKAHVLQQIGYSGRISPMDIYKCLWENKQLPLLLRITNPHDYKIILKILKLSNYSYKVIIIKDKFPVTKMDDIKPFETLQDLNDEDRMSILMEEVTIQGRKGVVLKDHVNKNMLDCIKCSDILHILLGNFNIGDPLVPLPQYFIERSIIKTMIKSEIFTKNHDEIFLIQNYSEYALKVASPQICKFEDLNFTNPTSISAIIDLGADVVSSEQLEKLKSVKKPIHILSVHDMNYFNWKWSYGSTETIDRFKVDLVCALAECAINNNFDNTVIISGNPGTGKSLLLDYVALHAPTNKWVLQINLKNHLSYLDHEECKSVQTEGSKHLHYFYHNTKNPQLTDLVFQKCVSLKNVVVLLDGYDEVIATHKKAVINLITSLHNALYEMWITTRPLERIDLEKVLKTNSIAIRPPTQDEQKQFLIRYSTAADIETSTFWIEKSVDKLLETTSRNGCRIVLPSGVTSVNQSFNLLNLYVMQKKITDIYKFTKKTCMIAALKSVFRLDDSQVYIVQQDDSYFQKLQVLQSLSFIPVNKKLVHTSIASYFAAEWLAENINSSNEKIREFALQLIKNRLNQSYEFLFNIFDKLLSEDCSLHRAIINNNVERVMEIMKTNPNDFEFHDIMNSNPLDYAIANRSLAVADKICEKLQNLPINIDIDNRSTYFMDCGKNKYEFLFTTLVKYFASREILIKHVSPTLESFVIDECENAIFIMADGDPAIIETHSTTMQTIQDYTSNLGKHTILDLFESEDGTYEDLRFGVSFGTGENVKSLITTERNINKQDADKNTALHYSVTYDNPECKIIISLLLSKGAEINKHGKYGNTALHYAIKNGRKEAVTILLKAAAVNEKNDFGETPLHAVAKHGLTEIAEQLLERHAEVNVKDDYGRTPLHYAADKNYVDILQLLLNKGAVFDEEDNAKITPLMYAARAGHQDSARLLLDKKADTSRKDFNGRNALHWAAYCNAEKMISLLLESGSEVNTADNSGNTALHYAVRTCNENLIDLLLTHKADLNAPNNLKQSALHLACCTRYADDYVKVIDNNFEPSQQESIIKKLITKKNANMRDCYGNTALYYATKAGVLATQPRDHAGALPRRRRARDICILT